MALTRLVAAIALTACIGTTPYRRREPRPEDDLDMASAPAVDPASRRAGPLSLVEKYPEAPWSDVQRARRLHDERYLSHRILRADIAAYLAVIDQFYAPHTPDQRTAHEVARKDLGLLEGLAPYSLESTMSSFNYASQRFTICVRTFNVMGHCDHDFVAPKLLRVPFELSEPIPGVAQLAIHDLSNAADPAWSKLPVAIDALATSKAIVLDMRDAIGADPRPLLPWLESITGQKPLRPLRIVERPADADRYVAAYNARFLAESRDRDVWASLVGPAPPAAKRTAKPIAIVVGAHCGAACELVARVLETYAGATVTGSVAPRGRLSRDEPALLVLPHSKIEVYFTATRYLLSADIEAATGPSDEWTAQRLDPIEGDGAAYALREVTARLAGGWPRCDSFRAYTRIAELPEALHAKLPKAQWLDKATCREDGRTITVVTNIPASAFRRYLATCAGPIAIEQHYYTTQRFIITAPEGIAALGPLSQLAQSEVVKYIDADCNHRFDVHE